jgi:hypothetical protein
MKGIMSRSTAFKTFFEFFCGKISGPQNQKILLIPAMQ